MRHSTRPGIAILACALLAASSAGAQEWERGDRPGTGAAAQLGKAVIHVVYGVPWFGAKLVCAAVVGTGASSVAWALSKGDPHTFKSIAVPWWKGTWFAPWPLFQDGVSFLGERPLLTVKRVERAPVKPAPKFIIPRDTEDPEAVERYWAKRREI